MFKILNTSVIIPDERRRTRSVRGYISNSRRDTYDRQRPAVDVNEEVRSYNPLCLICEGSDWLILMLYFVWTLAQKSNSVDTGEGYTHYSRFCIFFLPAPSVSWIHFRFSSRSPLSVHINHSIPTGLTYFSLNSI